MICSCILQPSPQTRLIPSDGHRAYPQRTTPLIAVDSKLPAAPAQTGHVSIINAIYVSH
jgi:hypothetical protein